MLWAATAEAEAAIQKILDTFAVRKVEEGTFRFCGKEVKQSPCFSVLVTCKDTSESRSDTFCKRHKEDDRQRIGKRDWTDAKRDR